MAFRRCGNPKSLVRAVMNTADRIKRSYDHIERLLWTSGKFGGRGGRIDWLAEMHAVAGLRFRKRLVPEIDLAEARRIKPRMIETRGESTFHQWLKYSAVGHLMAQGYYDAWMEMPALGGRLDCATASGKVAVECGDVCATKVADLISSGWRVLLLPYSRRNEASFHERNTGLALYELDAPPTALELLAKLRQAERAHLKELVSNLPRRHTA
jgi:hypothetical protein